MYGVVRSRCPLSPPPCVYVFDVVFFSFEATTSLASHSFPRRDTDHHTAMRFTFATAATAAALAASTAHARTPGQAAWIDHHAGASTSGGSIDNAAPGVGEQAVFYVSAARGWTLFASHLRTGDYLWNATAPAGIQSGTSPNVFGTGWLRSLANTWLVLG